MSKEDAESLVKDKNYIFSEVSAKTAQNINNLFYKDIHDAIMFKFKIGVVTNAENKDDEKESQPDSI